MLLKIMMNSFFLFRRKLKPRNSRIQEITPLFFLMMQSFQLLQKSLHLGIYLLEILVCCCLARCFCSAGLLGLKHVIVIEKTYTGLFLLMLKSHNELKYLWRVNNFQTMGASLFMAVVWTGSQFLCLANCLLYLGLLIS